MKVLIISDIHGGYKDLYRVLKNNTFDKLFILGDILRGPERDGYDKEKTVEILSEYRDKISAVKGNCDYDKDFEELRLLPNVALIEKVDALKFLLTHGHIYNYHNLPDVDYDILLSGHTHVPVLTQIDHEIYVNPGSISLPKGDFDKSYAIYEKNKITIHEIDGKVIMELMIDK